MWDSLALRIALKRAADTGREEWQLGPAPGPLALAKAFGFDRHTVGGVPVVYSPDQMAHEIDAAVDRWRAAQNTPQAADEPEED